MNKIRVVLICCSAALGLMSCKPDPHDRRGGGQHKSIR